MLVTNNLKKPSEAICHKTAQELGIKNSEMNPGEKYQCSANPDKWVKGMIVEIGRFITVRYLHMGVVVEGIYFHDDWRLRMTDEHRVLFCMLFFFNFFFCLFAFVGLFDKNTAKKKIE